MKNFLIAAGTASIFWMAQGPAARAGLDWTDHCHPDAVALSQAIRDFPLDRFDASTCADSIYRRGTCEVIPVDTPPASPGSPGGPGAREEEMIFKVKLRNNAGIYRSYEILMSLNAGADRHGSACGVRKMKQ